MLDKYVDEYLVSFFKNYFPQELYNEIYEDIKENYEKYKIKLAFFKKNIEEQNKGILLFKKYVVIFNKNNIIVGQFDNELLLPRFAFNIAAFIDKNEIVIYPNINVLKIIRKKGNGSNKIKVFKAKIVFKKNIKEETTKD